MRSRTTGGITFKGRKALTPANSSMDKLLLSRSRRVQYLRLAEYDVEDALRSLPIRLVPTDIKSREKNNFRGI